MVYRTTARNLDKAVGIAALVIGILVLVGELTFGWLIPFLGAVILIAGILMLIDVLPGSNVVGLAFLLIGALLLANLLGIPAVLGRALDLVIGVALIVIGVTRLT